MHEKAQRNSFIVSKALRTFVTAAVLTAAASQLAHTADSMIVGHVVGQDAVSAINLVLPLVEVLNCMAFLICFGANAMGGWLQMLSYGMCLFVATDGRPRMVTIAVVGGAVTNGIVDILTISILGMGVEGAALGSLSMFFVNILILINYLRQPSSSYHLKWPGKSAVSIFTANIKEGAPITVSNSLMVSL